MIATLALLLPYSASDTAMSVRHLELAYAFVFILQIGYAAYVAWQRWNLRANRSERPR
jgi:hypothetical protein